MRTFWGRHKRSSYPEIEVTDEGETINGQPVSERRLLRSKALHERYCQCGECDACLIWIAFKKYWKI